jgi:hypothetical protein
MSRLFKALPLLLLISAAFAQGTPFDCTKVFTGTATGVQLQANTATSRPCRSFAVTYTTTGFTSITVSFGTSPDATTANYSAVPNTACTSTAPPVAPCVLTDANPITAGKSGEGSYLAYGPYFGINVSSVTGSGTYTITVYGYKGLSANAGGTGGGSGGGNLTIAGTTNQVTVTGAGCTPTNSGTCTVKLPNANVTIDPTTGNFGTPGSYAAGVGGTKSGAVYNAGVTDGKAQGFSVNDTAGVSILYLMPSAAGTASDVLTDSGSATCPTLASGAPTLCHQLAWVSSTGSGNFMRSSVTVQNNTTNTGTSAMTLDLSASTVANAFKIPVLAGCTAGASGVLCYDSTAKSTKARTNNADSVVGAFASAPAGGSCVQTSGTTGLLTETGSGCGSGGGGSAGSTLFSTTASTTVTAASATTLIGTVTGSLTVAANTFTAGSVTEFMGQGFYTSTGLRTLTIDLKIGGTTRISTGAITAPGATLGTWRLRCVVTTRTAGASGTQIANCIFEMTGATLVAPGEGPMQTSTTWTVDTTGTLALDLQATWDATTGAPTITATNVAAWIPGAPVSSVGGQTGAVAGEGNGSKVQMFTGSDPATNDCAKFDANHNLVTSGAGCGGSGGITGSTTITPNSLSSAPAAAVPLTGWTLQNAVTAGASLNDFYPNEMVLSSGNFAALQWAGVTRSISVPYTLIAMIQLRGTVSGNTSTQLGGICVSDGTKYEQIGIQNTAATTNVGLEVRTLTSLSTGGTVITGPTTGIIGMTLAVKIVNNSTNRIFSYWNNGAWVQFKSEATGTFLTETAAGMCSLNDLSAGGFTLDEALKYWSVQ